MNREPVKSDCPLDANREPVKLEQDGRVTRHTAVHGEAGLEGKNTSFARCAGTVFTRAPAQLRPPETSLRQNSCPITAMRVLGATGRRVTFGAF